jgi:hypothetical protein
LLFSLLLNGNVVRRGQSAVTHTHRNWSNPWWWMVACHKVTFIRGFATAQGAFVRKPEHGRQFFDTRRRRAFAKSLKSRECHPGPGGMSIA